MTSTPSEDAFIEMTNFTIRTITDSNSGNIKSSKNLDFSKMNFFLPYVGLDIVGNREKGTKSKTEALYVPSMWRGSNYQKGGQARTIFI